MPSIDPRIDAYIKRKLRLQNLLKTFATANTQSLPWCRGNHKVGHAFFDYEGSVLCAMSAFKEHCGF